MGDVREEKMKKKNEEDGEICMNEVDSLNDAFLGTCLGAAALN